MAVPIVSRPEHAMRLSSIAYVDDEPDLREVVQLALSLMTRATVHCFESGAQALRELPSLHPDLVLLDVVMPDMNGPELYEQLVMKIPELKVVYISGYPANPCIRGETPEDEVQYLQKPFTAEALLERVMQVL